MKVCKCKTLEQKPAQYCMYKQLQPRHNGTTMLQECEGEIARENERKRRIIYKMTNTQPNPEHNSIDCTFISFKLTQLVLFCPLFCIF